jgi:hypothetical protein
MITPTSRATVSFISLVSLFAPLVLTQTVGLGACARVSRPVTWDASAQRGAFRFDNDAETSVDVYLVTDKREWRLGRVAPGARMLLRIPDAALVEASGFVRLAVLADAPLTVQAARDPRAILTIAQPTSELLAQRWTFVSGPQRSAQILAARVDTGRP